MPIYLNVHDLDIVSGSHFRQTKFLCKFLHWRICITATWQDLITLKKLGTFLHYRDYQHKQVSFDCYVLCWRYLVGFPIASIFKKHQCCIKSSFRFTQGILQQISTGSQCKTHRILSHIFFVFDRWFLCLPFVGEWTFLKAYL